MYKKDHDKISQETRDAAERLGISELAEALDYCENAIIMAVRRGQFPPAWYPVVQRLAVEKTGSVLPLRLFRFHKNSGTY